MSLVLPQSSGSEWRAEFLRGLSMPEVLIPGFGHGANSAWWVFPLSRRPLLEGEQEGSYFCSLSHKQKRTRLENIMIVFVGFLS